jgi:hypothetical protein
MPIEELLDGKGVPAKLKEHVRHHYAVWRQAAGRVRTLDNQSR